MEDRNLFGTTVLILIIFLTFTLAMCAQPNDTIITTWSNSINNPNNKEYVRETAFDLKIKIKNVTQEQFNLRYEVTPKTVIFTAIVDGYSELLSLRVNTFDEEQLLNDLKYLGYDVNEILEIYYEK
jgi:hypothetical protein